MGQITTYGNPEKSEHDKRAEAERLREFGPKVDIPPVPVLEDDEQHALDEKHLELLVKNHEEAKGTFYRGMKMAFGAALKDMPRAVEAGHIASRLGIRNPITSGVMGVGEGSGVIQDKIRFVEAILAKFGKRYRATGSIDRDSFESPTGV